MKEKKGGILRWPWNIIIYTALVLVLRIFAIPVILILLWVQRKNNPHGEAEGYCLSRTRKRLVWLIWSLLVLVIAAALLCMLIVGLKQDREYQETMDYVTLAFCGIGGPLFLAAGLYLGFVAVRDTFFPEKSALAKSIRSQLPYPEEAPPAGTLFAMVDEDLKENAQWFGSVGIGKEWVLGDGVNKIDRIRGIFVVDELHQHHTQTGTRTNRTLQLVLIDDRWQRTVTSFHDLNDLKAAADCLALRVPDARRGVNDANLEFWHLDESQREDFERQFQQQRNRRVSEQAQREMMNSGPQDMILRQEDGQVTSRVTASLVEEQLKIYLERGDGWFVLTPNRPVETAGRSFCALHVSVSEGNVRMLLEMQERPGYGLARAVTEQEAIGILSGWLHRNTPDFTGWEVRQINAPADREIHSDKRGQSHAKLSLLYASGAAESHSTFTGEDVQLAADGIVDGTYQLVELVHSVGYLWIRVTAGDKMDGRCTVEASRPGGEKLEFYISKMSPREAAAWLTGYPDGRFMPGGKDWKRVKK